jgi:hypothetical protein
MPINFPTTGLTNGQEFSPPGIPGAKYIYNAAKGAWIGTGGTGYTGSTGVGYAGSTGAGYTGAVGYAGSAGVGYTGSAGSGGGSASVSATDVGNATALLTAGAVGTYLFGIGVPPLPVGAGVNSDPGPAYFGLIIPGANLTPSAGGGVFSVAGTVATRFAPQGTWRCLGHAVGAYECLFGYYLYMPTLWVRIT